MPNYLFNNLSPVDFEILVRDLAQAELGIRLETFKTGRDKGIDFRYCPNLNNNLIIQCKHYLETGYNGLYRDLEKELKKLNVLAPERYILATSVALNVTQKEKIFSLFTPFIKSQADIWGRGDINNLIGRHDNIEKQNFKLWMQSTSIIEEILYSKIKNISREELYKIKNRTRYYVQNESFSEALKILDTHNFCIIAGIPGIGKTTLAEMLLLHYIKRGYEIVKITEDISEASIFDYINQPRIFYYDDFLGQTSLADKLSKNEDQKLVDFISAIEKSQVSKLILTTREYILNQARAVYEKLARTKFDTETCVVDLSKYNRRDKAKILYNHIFFSDLPPKFKINLLKEKRFLKIIDHKNYNPRIIDLMTSFQRVNYLESDKYFDHFIESLNNPLEIWRYAFEEQILQESRNLLNVMVTLPEEIFLEDLEEAFMQYHLNHSKKYSYSINPKNFKKALKELEGNFIKIQKNEDKMLVSFHSPSISDFVQKYLKDNKEEVIVLSDSLVFFEQLVKLWNYNNFSLGASFKLTYLVKKVVNLKSCRLITFLNSGKVTVKQHWTMTFEEKFSFFVEVFQKLPEGKYNDACIFLYNELEKRIDTGKSDSGNLIKLLIQLKKTKCINLEQNKGLLEKTKSVVFSEPDSFQQLEPACNFIENFSSLITMEDRQVGAGYLKKLMDDYSVNPDDPDWFRQDAADVAYLSKILKVETKYFIEDIEKRADELEKEIAAGIEEYYDEYRQDRETCDDQEIESIFSTLIKC